MFLFSPRSTLLPLGLRLGLRPKRDLISQVPPVQTVGRVICVTRKLNPTRVNHHDVMNQVLVVAHHVMKRLPGQLPRDPVPTIGQVIWEVDQSLLKQLVLLPSPPSRARLSPKRIFLKHCFWEIRGLCFLGFLFIYIYIYILILLICFAFGGFGCFSNSDWDWLFLGDFALGGLVGDLDCLFLYIYRERETERVVFWV